MAGRTRLGGRSPSLGRGGSWTLTPTPFSQALDLFIYLRPTKLYDVRLYMALEYGGTCGIFPVDQVALDHLPHRSGARADRARPPGTPAPPIRP